VDQDADFPVATVWYRLRSYACRARYHERHSSLFMGFVYSYILVICTVCSVYVHDPVAHRQVETHGGNNWGAIADLVPGRVETQCYSRCHEILDPSIDRAERRGKWAEDEVIKLKGAIQTHGDKRIGSQFPRCLGSNETTVLA
jgi:hypothetical protein